MSDKVRLAYLVSHPIQYQTPLLRRIAQEQDIDLTVFFGSDFSVHGYRDKGFGVAVKWDVPLLGGYHHELLPVIRDDARTGATRPLNYGILSRLRGSRPQIGGEGAFDVLWVHGYSTVNALHAMLAAKALGIPVLLRAESWLRDGEKNASVLSVKRMFFSGLKHLISGVLPIGSRNAAFWRHYIGEDVPQFLMPYAVDNNYFEERSRESKVHRAELLSELQLNSERPVILYAAKLTSRKRCGDLLEAYKRLSAKPRMERHPYLVIVGDGAERASLEAQAAASGLTDIRFCGFRNQSELPAFFELATVFVLPSEREPWGLIVNEVMNAGRPVIISDETGCQPDLITDGVEGVVFRTGDIEGLTDALRRVLLTAETSAAMGQRALERIRNWNFEQDVRGLRQAISAVTHKLTV